jgi:2-amino-4-hydroxy-6-hydroxymethyldihydropteridine diphosphokinase
MAGKTETTAYIGLGSNVGDRAAQLRQALEALAKLPGTTLVRESGVYEGKPWGNPDQSDFLNMAAEIRTTLAPHTLLRHLKKIERDMGREDGGEHWGPRTIDLDILLYGERVLRTASLVVPHMHMWDRRFVLEPLSELVPSLVSPEGKTVQEVLAESKMASQPLLPYGEARKLVDAESPAS